jgi:CheY-like chemotaxis protein
VGSAGDEMWQQSAARHRWFCSPLPGVLAMMTHTSSDRPVSTVADRRTVAIVSKHPDQHVLDTVLKSSDYDILLIESIGEAYTQIKQALPQIIIVCLEVNDLDGVQVLSMLNIDAATAQIPVVTYLASPDADDEDGELDSSFVHHQLLRSMN